MHTVEEQRGRRGKCPGLILIDEWGTWNPSRNLGSHRLEQSFVGSLTRAQLYQGTQGLFREILDRDLNTHTHTHRNRGCWEHPPALCSCFIASPMQRPLLTEPVLGGTDRRGA